jgi:hypothetical protein
VIARFGQPLTPKRYASALLARDLCLTVYEWPDAASGARAGEQDAMTDRELAEVGRFLREMRDRCLRVLGEELPGRYRRPIELTAGAGV